MSLFELQLLIARKSDTIISFLFGDIAATIAVVMLFDFHLFIVKATVVLTFGVLGGFGGLLGKDLYGWVKKMLEFINQKMKRSR